LERLTADCDVVLYYYNPNITPALEYEKRLSEQRRLAETLGVRLIEGEYDSEAFADAAENCEKCILLRLDKTAELAKAQGFELFTTTLSVSPHKNAALINKILTETGAKYDVEPLCEDFKKRDGYKRSVELSKIYGLYRQNYCGCKVKTP